MSITIAPQDVKVTEEDGLTIWFGWKVEGADLTRNFNHGVSIKDRRMAERVRAAFLAGAMFGPAELRTDNFGGTFVGASGKFLGRTLNADLTRMGF